MTIILDDLDTAYERHDLFHAPPARLSNNIHSQCSIALALLCVHHAQVGTLLLVRHVLVVLNSRARTGTALVG
jgi:hypothetical protein